MTTVFYAYKNFYWDRHMWDANPLSFTRKYTTIERDGPDSCSWVETVHGDKVGVEHVVVPDPALHNVLLLPAAEPHWTVAHALGSACRHSFDRLSLHNPDTDHHLRLRVSGSIFNSRR